MGSVRRLLLPLLVLALTAIAAAPAAAWQPASSHRQAVPKVVGSRNGGSGITLGSAATIGDRLAITAYHVVAEAKSITLVFLDGTIAPARPVLLEPAADLAVLRADRSLPARPFVVRDTPVRLGEAQTVIGYRQDAAEQPSVKSGRVTGFVTPGALGPDGRDWPLISSDTPASFGDSGGAVLDADGKLMGIVRGGLATSSAPTLLSTPAGAINAYLARGWVLDRQGNPVVAPAAPPSLFSLLSPSRQLWWRW
ncbi:MAG: serine protease [Chloroflexota bacterium]|nr:serine protease [Dehalococcoidia bacterium]MDW8253120.1 serine protease [Chloroflexota bacterium]